jgi:hypothetical protein
MNRKLAILFSVCALSVMALLIPSATAQTLPDITLSSTYAWDAAPGAAAYNVEVLDAINVQINPPGVVQTTDTSIGVGTFLFVGGVIAPAGTKKFRVQSVGPGGAPVSAWVQTNANFTGLGPPTNPRFE